MLTSTKLVVRPPNVSPGRHGLLAHHKHCIRARGIQSEAKSLAIFHAVALDVEYIHFFCSGAAFVLPGEVCLVDAQGRELFHSYCSPGEAPCIPGSWQLLQ